MLTPKPHFLVRICLPFLPPEPSVPKMQPATSMRSSVHEFWKRYCMSNGSSSCKGRSPRSQSASLCPFLKSSAARRHRCPVATMPSLSNQCKQGAHVHQVGPQRPFQGLPTKTTLDAAIVINHCMLDRKFHRTSHHRLKPVNFPRATGLEPCPAQCNGIGEVRCCTIGKEDFSLIPKNLLETNSQELFKHR